MNRIDFEAESLERAIVASNLDPEVRDEVLGRVTTIRESTLSSLHKVSVQKLLCVYLKQRLMRLQQIADRAKSVRRKLIF